MECYNFLPDEVSPPTAYIIPGISVQHLGLALNVCSNGRLSGIK